MRCTCWPLRGQARSHMALQASAPVIDPAPVYGLVGAPNRREEAGTGNLDL